MTLITDRIHVLESKLCFQSSSFWEAWIIASIIFTLRGNFLILDAFFIKGSKLRKNCLSAHGASSSLLFQSMLTVSKILLSTLPADAFFFLFYDGPGRSSDATLFPEGPGHSSEANGFSWEGFSSGSVVLF